MFISYSWVIVIKDRIMTSYLNNFFILSYTMNSLSANYHVCDDMKGLVFVFVLNTLFVMFYDT